MKKFSLPRIYPITDPGISGLSHVEQVRQLAAGGARLIQLRDKRSSSLEFYQQAAEAVRYGRINGIRILLNDRVDIAAAVGADGVHLGQDDLPPEHARALLGSGAIIGFSTHSVEQARAALALPIDYIAIGPVFDTSTKTDPDPVIGLEGVRAVREMVGPLPLAAIGGIDRRNARSVFEAGADSIALISDVLLEPSEIAARMKELTKIGSWINNVGLF